MKSNESFIDSVFEKEKAKRAEIRAAKKRTAAVCSSLALLLVICFATPTVMNMFSASKEFDAMESAPDTNIEVEDNALMDKNLTNNLGTQNPEENKNNAPMDSDNSFSDDASSDFGRVDETIDFEEAPKYEKDDATSTEGEIESEKDSEIDGENDDAKTDYSYIVIAAVAVILVAICIAFALLKKKM